MDIEQIFENNKVWIVKQLATNANYFDNLRKGQSPEFLYIGSALYNKK